MPDYLKHQGDTLLDRAVGLILGGSEQPQQQSYFPMMDEPQGASVGGAPDELAEALASLDPAEMAELVQALQGVEEPEALEAPSSAIPFAPMGQPSLPGGDVMGASEPPMPDPTAPVDAPIEGVPSATDTAGSDGGDMPDIDFKRLDADPDTRKAVRAELLRHEKIARKHKLPIRADLQRARKILSRKGFAGLKAALDKGAVPPAIVMPLLTPKAGGRVDA